ncbi:CCA tRNA nucleotidyltransferase [Paenisporosarcina indica]|uniref:CCA tRNA nucleotidyltransferase n=1 Tax=Paenisporosarcina indica TaxID=650093 RepID=UPI00094FE242|nr:CCA tRNA nucleotidyltransferase [Paenisporosarcina indica]
MSTTETKQWQVGKEIIKTLKQKGYEAVFVGGAVRDFVRNKVANDIDIATSALPEEVKAIFKRTADVGLAHGTVLVIEDFVPIEVTTFRTDGEYEDHRRPTDVKFVRSLEEDLKRRDFTINALAMTEDFHIIDLFDGQRDLENGCIRTVGNPLNRFNEDALRMLRAIRFTAQLGFSIESTSFEAIKSRAHEISFVSVERISAELEKIWMSANLFQGIKSLVKSNLASHLPGDHAFANDKWKTLGNPQNSSVCWAYLCLLNKQPVVAQLAKQYKLSNDLKNQITQLVKATQIRCNGFFTIEDLYQFSEDVLVQAEILASKLKDDNEPLQIDKLVHLKKSLPIQSIRELAVTGQDIMEWFDKPGGPWLKETLTQIERAVLHQKVTNDATYIKEWLLNESNHKE